MSFATLFIYYIYRYNMLYYLYNFSYFLNWCFFGFLYHIFLLVFQNFFKICVFLRLFCLFFCFFHRFLVVYTYILYKIQKKYKKSVKLFAF